MFGRKLFSILIVVVVVKQLYKFIKTHQTVQFNRVRFIVCKYTPTNLYYNKKW